MTNYLKVLLPVALVLCLAVGCSEDTKTKNVGQDLTGPYLQGAKLDSTAGTLTLRFNENVTIATAMTDADFTLPVTDDTLGNACSVAAGTQLFEVVITLGTGYTLTASGDYQSAETTAGSPSGIDIAASGLIKLTDDSGNACQQSPASAGAIDIYE